jgi:DNA-binding NtrC family response regulator
MKSTVLIVDDESYVRDSLATVLERREFRVRTAAGTAEALRGDALGEIDALVTDLKMPGRDGLDLLREMAGRYPALPVIVLTGHGTVLSAVECMKAGARDYLLKPANPEELVQVLRRALTPGGTATAGGAPGAARTSAGESGGAGWRGRGAKRRILGESTAWLQVLRLIELAAPADTSVLLLGESGTGKEELARLLHQKSARAAAPFVCVNCAAVPSELFESEFFGHRRGAFTGAVADREGRFRAAHRGTLFLDEINSLPEVNQAKVLRVLQDGVFELLGETQPTAVDVRLVSASNTDLEAEVERARFRADLFYRINVMTIHVPPLRERPEDIPVLAHGFLEELSRRQGKRVHGLHPETAAILLGYGWPGNVRELRNVIERGVLLEPGELLTPASLPLKLGREQSAAHRDVTLRGSLADAERRLLEEALTRTAGVRREAARLLGVDERNLAYYLRKHGLMEKGKKGG